MRPALSSTRCLGNARRLLFGFRLVRGFPSEDVAVIPEEVDEHAFLFVRECFLDANTLGCIGGVDLDMLRVHGGLECAGADLRSVRAPLGDDDFLKFD